MKKIDTKNKNYVMIALIYAILFGVLNLLVFTIFQTHTSVFWISYVFMVIAFAVQITSMFLSFKKADVETAFFGIPLASLSVYYMVAAIVVGFLFMIFQRAGFTFAFVIQLLIVAAFSIIAIISLMSRDTVQQIGDNIKVNVAGLQSVLIDVEMLRDACSDPDLKESLRKLSETIKYSDPMTNDLIANVEQRIKNKILELRINIEDNKISDAKQTCGELERLYVERNKKLAISK